VNLRVLVVSVLVVSACATESPSNNGTTSPTPAGSASSQTQIQCHVDSDCGLIREEQSGTTGCCFKCGEYTAGTVAQSAAAADMCKKKGPCERPISCAEPAEPAFVAKCNGAACIAVKR
jgi:hypothetical protein